MVILITGNYTFFNLLTMALCLVLFDDAALRKVLPRRLTDLCRVTRTRCGREKSPLMPSERSCWCLCRSVWCSFTRPSRAEFRAGDVGRRGNCAAALVNTYGLFAVMTTTRPEIMVEGSNDGVNWSEYAFKYKPGDVMRAPRWNAPHQPRLDWQMWFAALGTAEENPWFMLFMQRLLENSPAVIALLGKNPFPHKPPKYVRAVVYDYRFSSPEEKEKTGAWWVRQPEGVYYPPIALALNCPYLSRCRMVGFSTGRREMAKTFGYESTTDEVLEGVDFSGKRVLVTGVSAGLGVETGRSIVAHGGTVVGTARDLAKARNALAQAGNLAVELVEMDLASLASVRKAADESARERETVRRDHSQCRRDGVSTGQDERWFRNAVRDQSPGAFRVRESAGAAAEERCSNRHAVVGGSSDQRR